MNFGFYCVYGGILFINLFIKRAKIFFACVCPGITCSMDVLFLLYSWLCFVISICHKRTNTTHNPCTESRYVCALNIKAIYANCSGSCEQFLTDLHLAACPPVRNATPESNLKQQKKTF